MISLPVKKSWRDQKDLISLSHTGLKNCLTKAEKFENFGVHYLSQKILSSELTLKDLAGTKLTIFFNIMYFQWYKTVQKLKF